MKDYSAMSDFEINKAVALQLMSIETLRGIGVPDDVMEILMRCRGESQKSLPQQFKDAIAERNKCEARNSIEKSKSNQKCPNHRKPAKRLRRSKS